MGGSEPLRRIIKAIITKDAIQSLPDYTAHQATAHVPSDRANTAAAALPNVTNAPRPFVPKILSIAKRKSMFEIVDGQGSRTDTHGDFVAWPGKCDDWNYTHCKHYNKTGRAPTSD